MEEGQALVQPVANEPGVWYFQYTVSCVLCGWTEVSRERRKGPKPEDLEDRYDYQEFACGDHFM